MNSFLENLTIGLIISLISAIFFIAYKHPKVLKKYYKYLYLLNFIWYISSITHFITKTNAYELFLKKYPNDKIFKIRLEELKNWSNICVIVFFAIIILLFFLDDLRNIIDKAEKEEPK